MPDFDLQLLMRMFDKSYVFVDAENKECSVDEKPGYIVDEKPGYIVDEKPGYIVDEKLEISEFTKNL